jgi:hypothetical protein
MAVTAAQADDNPEAGFSGRALAGFNISGAHRSCDLRRVALGDAGLLMRQDLVSGPANRAS